MDHNYNINNFSGRIVVPIFLLTLKRYVESFKIIKYKLRNFKSRNTVCYLLCRSSSNIFIIDENVRSECDAQYTEKFGSRLCSYRITQKEYRKRGRLTFRAWRSMCENNNMGFYGSILSF